jgi:hypothetical protein
MYTRALLTRSYARSGFGTWTDDFSSMHGILK